MSPLPPLGLYPSRALLASQRLAAGAVLALDVPLQAGGATLFRHSLWLGVPAAAREALALSLAASQLRLRFAPRRFTVDSGFTGWFSRVQTTGDQEVRFDFLWPARVVQLDNPRLRDAEAFDLFRADGSAVAGEPTQAGVTGRNLAPAWVGSPLVVRMARPIPNLEPAGGGSLTGNLRAMRAPQAAIGAVGGTVGVGSAPAGIGDSNAVLAQIRLVQHSHVVPSLQIQGLPTSPRLRLSLEARAGAPELLLWQALLPGAHAGEVDLPAGPLADEWAGALEQLRSRLAGDAPPSDAPALLRLDLESDEPCTVTLQQAAFALDAERELLAAPARFDFDGTRRISQPLQLLPPAGLQSLRFAGRCRGSADADPTLLAALPPNRRHGLLLDAERRVLRRGGLAAPTALAGLRLAWQPLSEQVAGRLRLRADGGNGRPAQTHLAELDFRIDTPEETMLTLRFAPLDLQPQPLWIELALQEGSGLWLADPAQPAASGEVEGLAGGAARPLGVAPVFGWLPAAPPAADAPRRIELAVGAATLALNLPAEPFAIECPAILLGALVSQPLRFTSAAPGSVTLESARGRVRLL